MPKHNLTSESKIPDDLKKLTVVINRQGAEYKRSDFATPGGLLLSTLVANIMLEKVEFTVTQCNLNFDPPTVVVEV